MDIVGLVISLSQVAWKAYTLLGEIRSASSDQRALANEMKSLYGQLLKLQTSLADPASSHPDKKALDDLNDVIEPVIQDLTRLCKKLEARSGWKLRSSILWVSEKKDIANALDQVTRAKQNISLAVSGRALVLSEQINIRTEKTQKGVEVLVAKNQMELAQVVTSWLSPLDFSSVQERIHNSVQPGTGRWLFSCEDFNVWISSPGSVLWCHGIPGAGKTTLTSIVVEWLRESFRANPTVKVACAYCDYKDLATQNLQNVVMGLWRQLVDLQTSHHVSAVELWTSMGCGQKPRDKVPTERLLEFLEMEISSSSQTFLVLDALDEFPEAFRKQLVDILKSLLSNGRCNLMVTSRGLDNIRQLFENDLRIEIDADENDLIAYVRARTQEYAFQMLKPRLPTMETDVERAVVPKCDKMFLLARLHMDSLSKRTSVNHFKKLLSTLPTGLETMYDDALSRIAADALHKEYAIKALYWISFAKRPLTTDELMHALAVETGDMNYEENNELLDEITSICAGLVTIDEETGLARLAHHTTDEYLKKTRDRHFPGISIHMTSVLLTYVSFNSFKVPPPRVHSDATKTLRKYPLLQYASLNWGHHYSESDEMPTDIRSRALEFFKLPQRFADFFIEEMINVWMATGQPRALSGLHLAILFDLQEFVSVLHTQEMRQNGQPLFCVSPLSLAISLGRDSIVRLLVDEGADIHGMPGDPLPPLHRAAGEGHSYDICKLLLQRGANVNLRVTTNPIGSVHWGPRQASALHAAVWHNNKEVMELLINNGAELYAETVRGNTPLHYAMTFDLPDTRQILLNAFQAPILRSKPLIGPLVQLGSRDSLDNMIKKGLGVNEISEHGGRALDLALELGDKNMVSALLENGAIPLFSWTQDQKEVSCFSHKPWYNVLCQRLDEHQADWHLNVKGRHASVERSWRPPLTIDVSSPVEGHIELVVPDDIILPIETIIFKTTSHDRPYTWPKLDQGTYTNSSSWFDISVKDAENERCNTYGFKDVIRLQSKVGGSNPWRTHTTIWNRLDVSPAKKEFMESIKTGSTIEVVARALYPGWRNYVRFIKVDIYGSQAT